MSGTAHNIPSGHRLDLFLHFERPGGSNYYAAGDPNTALSVGNGRWSGRIYIGNAEPIAILLVLLSPSEVAWVNAPEQEPQQNNGFTALPGKVLDSNRYTSIPPP